MIDPLVSVILLSYNNLQFLYNAIDSVLLQNYPRLELIISDDCTEGFDPEKYLDYINKNKKDNLIHANVRYNPANLGTVRNINDAIRLANGEYIKIMGADDAFYDEYVIQNVVDFMKTQTASHLVATNVMYCNSDMQESGKLVKQKFEKHLCNKNITKKFIRLCMRNYIPAPGIFFKKSFFANYGLFDEKYKLLEDWPTWLRLTREGETIEFFDLITVKYRADAGVGTSTNKVYLTDKKLCFDLEIKPFKKQIGAMNYLICRILSTIFTSNLLRQLYNVSIRKNLTNDEVA